MLNQNIIIRSLQATYNGESILFIRKRLNSNLIQEVIKKLEDWIIEKATVEVDWDARGAG